MAKHFLAKAGKVGVTDAVGQVVEFDLPAGVYDDKALLKSLSVTGGHPPIEPETFWQSAANPTYRVSPAAREARHMRMMLQSTRAAASRAEAALAAMDRAQRAPGRSVPAGDVAAAGHDPEGIEVDESSVSAT